MKKEVILMYSGGLDSVLSCIRLVRAGYKVYLIHFDNGSSIGSDNIQKGAERLINRFKNEVEYLGIASTASYFLYYRSMANIENLNAKELFDKYGKISISQYRCLLCRMAMYTYSIALARKMGISYIAEGARKSQLFAIEQDELLNEFRNLCEKFNIKLLTPVLDVVDDYEKENEIYMWDQNLGTSESKCLLGFPMNRELSSEELDDIKRFYKNIRYLQEKDILEERVILQKLTKDKITWY
jgi:adenylyl- and sulfurtransferase ThiI